MPFLRRPGSLRLPLIENILLSFPASLLRIDSLSLWFLIENPTLRTPSLLVHRDPHVSATHYIVAVKGTVAVGSPGSGRSGLILREGLGPGVRGVSRGCSIARVMTRSEVVRVTRLGGFGFPVEWEDLCPRARGASCRTVGCRRRGQAGRAPPSAMKRHDGASSVGFVGLNEGLP